MNLISDTHLFVQHPVLHLQSFVRNDTLFLFAIVLSEESQSTINLSFSIAHPKLVYGRVMMSLCSDCSQ